MPVIAIALVVTRQILELNLPGGLGLAKQVPEFVVVLDATLGHQARREGQVVVRCDIPVDRCAQLEAAAIGVADLRNQEPGFPPIVQRKSEIGQVQKRYALELDHGLLGGATPGFTIKLDLVRFQHPVLFVLGTGRVTYVFELYRFFNAAAHRRGRAANAAIGNKKLGARKACVARPSR